MSSSKLLLIPAIAVVIATPFAAAAQDASQDLQPPRWSVPPRPTADDFPEDALQADASGHGVVACDVAADGAPTNCEIVSETPEGMGFGQAAMDIVLRGRVAVPEAGQADTASPPRFAVRIPFNLGPELTIDAPPPRSGNPKWLTPPRPGPEDYPSVALRRSSSGAAAVQCEVGPRGRPTNCIVLQERPENLGFGEAAVRIVSRGQLNSETAPETIGAKFVVVVPFNLD